MIGRRRRTGGRLDRTVGRRTLWRKEDIHGHRTEWQSRRRQYAVAQTLNVDGGNWMS
jgi:hypothetical protein